MIKNGWPKWSLLWLLTLSWLLITPSLIYGLEFDECKALHERIGPEWNRHNELLEQFQKFGSNEKEARLHLLNEATGCCERSVTYCDKILHEIEKKHSAERKKPWWKELKEQCEKDKNSLKAEINQLRNVANTIIAFDRAQTLFRECEEKAARANSKNDECQRVLSNTALIPTLIEIAQLYERASAAAKEAHSLISPYSDEASKANLKEAMDIYQGLAIKFNKEADEWSKTLLSHKTALREKLAALNEERELFDEKGLKRSAYEIQKQTVLLLEQLIEMGEERERFQKELSKLIDSIEAFEKEADRKRLTENKPSLSPEEFRGKEKERRELFFKSDLLLHPELFLQSAIYGGSPPFALPLDGQFLKKDKNFALYTEQYYRFLVQSDAPLSEITVKVYDKGKLLHEETIALPMKNTPSWERYLAEGMLFIPETKLKEFGLELRLSFFCDPRYHFSMVIAQKCARPDYQFFFSGSDNALYECSVLESPPWQLSLLRKPLSPRMNRASDTKIFPSLPRLNIEPMQLLTESYPLFIN